MAVRRDAGARLNGDPVLEALVREAEDDRGTLALVLTGSRAAGTGDDASDYDVVRVVGGDDCDAAQVKEGLVDRITVTEERLERLAREEGHWARSGFVGARVLFERTGRIEALVARIASYDEETGARLAYEHYDGYLNGFVRSLRAWQQGNEFGARLQAAESLTCLVKALFALERRVAPYHDRLVGPALDALAGQGWRPGELERTLLELARSAAPAAQQALEARVEALMESRGVRAHAEWGEQLERLKAARF